MKGRRILGSEFWVYSEFKIANCKFALFEEALPMGTSAFPGGKNKACLQY
jgi:hypothetical protein